MLPVRTAPLEHFARALTERERRLMLNGEEWWEMDATVELD